MPESPDTPRKVGRPRPGERGNILTSDFIHTDAELELIRAVDRWKQRTGKRFPALSDILAIVRDELGYRKVEAQEGQGNE